MPGLAPPGCVTWVHTLPRNLVFHQPVVCASVTTNDAISLAKCEMTCSRAGELPTGTQRDAIRASASKWEMHTDTNHPNLRSNLGTPR